MVPPLMYTVFWPAFQVYSRLPGPVPLRVDCGRADNGTSRPRGLGPSVPPKGPVFGSSSSAPATCNHQSGSAPRPRLGVAPRELCWSSKGGSKKSLQRVGAQAGLEITRITRYKQSKWNVQSLNKKGVNVEPNPSAWFSSRVVETAAQAEAAVAADKHDGYVAIKVYSLLSPEACAATQSPLLP